MGESAFEIGTKCSRVHRCVGRRTRFDSLRCRKLLWCCEGRRWRYWRGRRLRNSLIRITVVVGSCDKCRYVSRAMNGWKEIGKNIWRNDRSKSN
ncbi:unnamed protein product [Allacma fusca]|uniref:Uncharacterized protein n=1 Tax=Allacma fusca TaxID=39272 RepID=A0A8J2JVS8_9HEXA|nr:unnamed protein product [Allacma fusca]